jgi:Family of unknown function (DUF6353)
MKLPVSLTRNFHRNVLIVKKQSPHILFVTGVLGSITSTVMACRATLKLTTTVDEIQIDIKNINDMKQNLAHSAVDTYTDKQYKKDAAYVYTKASVKIARLYAPSVIIGVASIGALTGSHIQMTKRNAALMGAYAALQKAYDEYRERVREQVGEERELELFHGVKTDVIKNELDKKEEIKSFDPNQLSVYSKMFDEYSKHWVKDPELNRLYIQCQQNYANNLLRARGHLFLNEVYDMLDVDRTQAGSVVGWVIGKDGDNFVDFGIYEAFNARFVNGWERSIILDFNVDGVIWDKI